MNNKDFLRRLPIFAEFAEDDLSKLCALTKNVNVKTGDFLVREGDMGDAMYVIVGGEFEVTQLKNKRPNVIATRHTGDYVGEGSLLEEAPRSASVRALSDSHVIEISREAFYTLLATNLSAVLSLLRTFVMRLRSTEKLAVQQEKLASLGTLAAGLAHELNNPAAAVRRSAEQLREMLGQWQKVSIDLDRLTFTPSQAQMLADLRDQMEARSNVTLDLDPLTRSDMEGEMQDWLDQLDINDAWDIAPVLVGFGWSPDELQSVLEPFTEEQVPVIIPWLSSGSSTYGLLNEVHSSSQRISEIVKAVKTYSYLDQAPIQSVNIHEGLDNTLVILRHNLKAGVTVKKEYAPDLPQIEGYGSELNQVWTNLIDNAISAMKGQGELTLRTYTQGANVVVEISDNGPGIPAEIQSVIFEPFFTTKEPGVGTGLGLHIVYNIVVDKHQGRIDLDSHPGRTTFRITLPLRLARDNQA